VVVTAVSMSPVTEIVLRPSRRWIAEKPCRSVMSTTSDSGTKFRWGFEVRTP
jgi:hypothetical protein